MGYPTKLAKDKPVWIIFKGERVGIGAKSSIPAKSAGEERRIIEEATPEQYEELADKYPEYIVKGTPVAKTKKKTAVKKTEKS